jgi:cell volume regulation protein A
MYTQEPEATALLLATCGLLLGVSVAFSRASQRTGVPIALLFLIVGMLAGSEGVGGIYFDDYHFAFRVGVLALALILFDGGLNTPLSAVRRAAAPAGILATAGVAGTAVLVASGAHLLGLGWPAALLLGAVVSSTDAASVFAVLRGSGLQLKRRVA